MLSSVKQQRNKYLYINFNKQNDEAGKIQVPC